jgi:hypothetical protein
MIYKNLINILFFMFFLPTFSLADAILEIDSKEYSNRVNELSAACKEKSMPVFSGFCLSREYGTVAYNNSAQTSISLALEIASFDNFYSNCEHSDFSSVSNLLSKAKNVLEAQKFFEEIKRQKEALSNYVGRFYFCKEKGENNKTILKKIKWFEFVIGKYSGEGPTASAKPSDAGRGSGWHIGKFSNRTGPDSAANSVSVRCSGASDCEYFFLKESAPTSSSVIRTRNIEQIEPSVPNGNLAHIRRAVAETPNEYESSRNGRLLRNLRPVLESTAKLEACMGEPEMKGAWGIICKIDQHGPALPDAMLLITTMNPTCNRQVFCAYYMFPLWRVPSTTKPN